MPGAAPFLKRFARHPHAAQHQDGATATKAVRASRGIGALEHAGEVAARGYDGFGPLTRRWYADLDHSLKRRLPACAREERQPRVDGGGLANEHEAGRELRGGRWHRFAGW